MAQTQSAGAWIDFRALREKLDFHKVLEHYRVKLKIKGDRANGFCPLPTHQGKRKSPSFSVDLPRGIWQCFGCAAKGNVLDFACRMDGLNPSQGADIRQTALMLRDLFGIASSAETKGANESSRETIAVPAGRRTPAPSPSPAADVSKIVVNQPIDFELQTLDYDHPYLRGRGFTDETIRHFGLGYCNRGMLKYRIAIPVHDPAGRLVGYAGRLTKDSMVNEANPKYKLPGSRERDGVTLEFRKSQLLYNVHRIMKRVPELVVVEGFPSTWWLHQHGYVNVVALMGADCSEEQAKLILERVELDGRIQLMPDGNEAGERCAESLLRRLACYRFVRWVKLKPGEQPTDCGIEDLEALLSV